MSTDVHDHAEQECFHSKVQIYEYFAIFLKETFFIDIKTDIAL